MEHGDNHHTVDMHYDYGNSWAVRDVKSAETDQNGILQIVGNMVYILEVTLAAVASVHAYQD